MEQKISTQISEWWLIPAAVMTFSGCAFITKKYGFVCEKLSRKISSFFSTEQQQLSTLNNRLSEELEYLADGELLDDRRFPHEFLCPLTKRLLNDPVILSCGHTFERKAITRWYQEGNSTCPLDRCNVLTANTHNLPVNQSIKKIMAGFFRQSKVHSEENRTLTRTTTISLANNSMPQTPSPWDNP